MATSPGGTGPDTPARGGQGLRLLLVEDHAETAVILAHLLRRDGHSVVVATDGRTALHAAGVWRPDMVLLDIGLPDVDGWKVARRLREQLRARPPLTIAVSEHGREEDGLPCRESGVHMHLAKPVEPARLCELVRLFQQILGR
jgi:CheY-like chemotaxis protein